MYEETEAKHDKRLEAILERCEKINITLNKDKCEFKVKEVTYTVHWSQAHTIKGIKT